MPYSCGDVGTAYTKKKGIDPSGLRPPPLKGEELFVTGLKCTA
jgi:hypothetical protein